MGAGGLVYSRFNHPNTEIVEDRLALLDGAESALVTASGMAAIGAVMLTYLRPGDALVHYTPLYGGTETLIGKVLSGWGIHPVAFTDGTVEEPLRRALEEAARLGPVKMVYLETPANPTNAMIDLALTRATVDAWARNSGQTPLVVCDNTMLGPVFQTPLAQGVDICVYSLTKYVGGHSDLIAGGITGTRELLRPVRQTRSAFGFQLDPHSSWMLTRSMETLALRMDRAAESGRRVAEWLATNRILPCAVLHPEIGGDSRMAGIYARHRVARLPPGIHNALRRATGRPRRYWRHGGADPPVGRTGASGRFDQGLGTGLPTGNDTCRIANLCLLDRISERTLTAAFHGVFPDDSGRAKTDVLARHRSPSRRDLLPTSGTVVLGLGREQSHHPASRDHRNLDSEKRHIRAMSNTPAGSGA
jgi:hypothetical protein